MSDYYPDVDLLPCPFCGEQPSMWRDEKPDEYGLRMWHISCANGECGVAPYVDVYPDDDIVIEYWQKRVPVNQHDGWRERLDERQRKEVDLACVYAREYAHGTAGHNQYMLIAALVKMLDEAA